MVPPVTRDQRTVEVTTKGHVGDLPRPSQSEPDNVSNFCSWPPRQGSEECCVLYCMAKPLGLGLPALCGGDQPLWPCLWRPRGWGP